MTADYTNEQTRGLSALLDTLIPPDAEVGMPGAGSVTVDYLAEHAAELQPLVVASLEALDAAARERGAASFADLGPAVQEAALAWGAAKAHVHLRRRRERT